MTSRKRFVLVAGTGIVLLGIAGYAAVTNVLAVGVIADSELINGPAAVTFRQFLLPPGEVGGWHYHPGISVNAIKRGTVTVEDGCGGEDMFTAGQAFEKIGGRIHRASNLGAEEVEEFNVFIVPEGSPTTVPVPERRCGPPRSTNECRNGGWMSFTHPRRFGNQGDCIQSLRRGQ